MYIFFYKKIKKQINKSGANEEKAFPRAAAEKAFHNPQQADKNQYDQSKETLLDCEGASAAMETAHNTQTAECRLHSFSVSHRFRGDETRETKETGPVIAGSLNDGAELGTPVRAGRSVTPRRAAQDEARRERPSGTAVLKTLLRTETPSGGSAINHPEARPVTAHLTAPSCREQITPGRGVLKGTAASLIQLILNAPKHNIDSGIKTACSGNYARPCTCSEQILTIQPNCWVVGKLSRVQTVAGGGVPRRYLCSAAARARPGRRSHFG